MYIQTPKKEEDEDNKESKKKTKQKKGLALSKGGKDEHPKLRVYPLNIDLNDHDNEKNINSSIINSVTLKGISIPNVDGPSSYKQFFIYVNDEYLPVYPLYPSDWKLEKASGGSKDATEGVVAKSFIEYIVENIKKACSHTDIKNPKPVFFNQNL